jgi:hypothetical protein
VKDHEGPAEPSYLFLKKSGENGSVPLSLTPKESAGLTQAIKAPRPAQGGTPYVRADVKNGQLVFSPVEKQASVHPAGNEPEISIGSQSSPGGSTPARLIASPDALKLLEQKAGKSAR